MKILSTWLLCLVGVCLLATLANATLQSHVSVSHGRLDVELETEAFGVTDKLKKKAKALKKKASELKDKAKTKAQELAKSAVDKAKEYQQRHRPPQFFPPVMPNDPMKFGVDAQRDLGVDRLLAQLSDMIYTSGELEVGESLALALPDRKCVSAELIYTATHNGQLGWVLHLPSYQALVVVFRGTHVTGGIKTAWANIKTDLTFTFSACDMHGVDCGRVSKGFLHNWNLFKTEMQRVVLEYADEHSIAHLFVTGHSLGGAVASLAAFHFASYLHTQRDPQITRIHVGVFGSPRVGNKKWAEAVRATMQLTHTPFVSGARYVTMRKKAVMNLSDPITELSADGTGYYHMITGRVLVCPKKLCKFNHPGDLVKFHSMSTYIDTMSAELKDPLPLAQCSDWYAFYCTERGECQ